MRSAIGIDFGGTSVKFGLVDEKGKLRDKQVLMTRQYATKKILVQAMGQMIGRLCDDAKHKKLTVKGVGIGMPGPVDVRKGMVYFLPNVPGWKNTLIAKELKRYTNLPIVVDNDANALAYGEYRFGPSKKYKDVLVLTLGTGVGGGLVLGGKPYYGHAFSAVEIGHTIIDESGPLCGCGNRGCVETFVGNGHFCRYARTCLQKSKKGLLYRWVHHQKKELTPLLCAQAAKKGDPLSKMLWTRAADKLATALAGYINTLNPECVILGGGIAQNGHVLMDPLIRSLRKKTFPIAMRSVRVMQAKLATDSGIIGAAALALKQ